MKCYHYLWALFVALNAILLITVCRQTFFAGTSRTSGAVSSVPSRSHTVIRSTDESLYAMYGEGDPVRDRGYSDYLLDYIRSMASRQAPGGVRLASRKVKPGQAQKRARVDFSQVGGSQFVDELLGRRRGGFFVECGAFRGEDLSDTLFFELERNWTGLLIEAHPDYHREILRKNRRSLVLRACLSFVSTPGLTKFKLAGWGSGVSALNKNDRTKAAGTPETDVQCFSLNSIMAAFEVRHIDLMVLDVEGAELPVLQTIDWTRLSIDVFSIEYSDNNRVEKLNRLRRFFNETGINYREVGKLPLGAKDATAQDVIFMRK